MNSRAILTPVHIGTTPTPTPQASTTSSNLPSTSAALPSTSSSRPLQVQPRPTKSKKTHIYSRQDSDEEEEEEDDEGEAKGNGSGQAVLDGAAEVHGGSQNMSQGHGGELSTEKENPEQSNGTSRQKQVRPFPDLDSRNDQLSDGAASAHTPDTEPVVSREGVGGSVFKESAKRRKTAPTSHLPQRRRSLTPSTPRPSSSSTSGTSARKSPVPSASRSQHSQPLDSSIQLPVPSVHYLARPRGAGGKFVGKPDGPGDARFKPSASKAREDLKEEAERYIGGATGRGGRRKKE